MSVLTVGFIFKWGNFTLYRLGTGDYRVPAKDFDLLFCLAVSAMVSSDKN